MIRKDREGAAMYILTFHKPIIPKKVKIRYCLEKVEQYISTPLKCLIVRNMDTTRKVAEDVQYVEGVAKKTLTTWGKIFSMNLNVQTAKRIILHFQNFAM